MLLSDKRRNYIFFGTFKQLGSNSWKKIQRVVELISDYPANQLDDLLPPESKLKLD